MVPTEEDSTLPAQILKEAHMQRSVAHPGIRKTIAMIKSRYYWQGWAKDVKQFVQSCTACRRAENPRDKTPGLLKPLPIPERSWQHIGMDFQSFPKSRSGHDSALVVVDRLSKQHIAIPCFKTATAKDLADIFIKYVYRWKGPPDSIVSDRGPQFVSVFWREFCKILGIKLKLATAHHAQTAGQVEIVN